MSWKKLEAADEALAAEGVLLPNTIRGMKQQYWSVSGGGLIK